MKYPFFIIFFLLFGACTSEDTLFEKVSANHTNITFNNAIKVTDSLNVLEFEYIYNGAGVGVGDVNNDGLTDIFFAGNQVSSQLYLNKGNFEFEDITTKANVSTKSWCTGVAMIDINQDGKLDIYLSTIHPDRNKSALKLLFINQGNDKNGVPIFKESAKEVGLADDSYGTQASFFDYDLDGDLDMYLLTNAMEGYNRNNSIGQHHDASGRRVDKLFRNEGNNKQGLPIFRNVSKEAGIVDDGWGLGVIINDINQDGYPDIFVGNDFFSNDHLYINNKNGTFSNKTNEYFRHLSQNSMGVDMADINNDGLNDLVVLDMLPDDNLRQKTMFANIEYDRFQDNLRKKFYPQYVRNVLQINNGNGSFSDIGYLSGVAATDWSWSPLLADFDNDGWRDLLITNGYRLDVTDLDFIVYRRDFEAIGNPKDRLKKMQEAFATLTGVKKPNFLFKNKGNLQFENATKSFGLDDASYTNGTAYADFDNDGDLDLVMNNIDDEAFIYRNKLMDKNKDASSVNNHFLRLKLQGNNQNRSAFGAKVNIWYQGKYQFAEHQTIRGYKSTVEDFIHFGVGNASKIDSLKITWASGKEQVIKNISPDRVLIINENNALSISKQLPKEEIYTFKEVSQEYHIDWNSEELEYNDFLIQHTLQHKHSELGGGIAVGDVNNDGLEDFFVGGSAHKQGAFFLQNANGKFTKKHFIEKTEEDMGVLLIDIDNDKDLDLYCVSGSSEFTTNNTKYQDRLYLNDGKGNFKPSVGYLPITKSSGICINACDFDKDGDLDIFRGGRVRSTEYPLAPESYLFQNNGKGHFNNIALSIQDLSLCGMVTAALWTDYDNDTWMDLIVVGEFMPICIYKNNKGKSFTKMIPKGLEKSNGWWNSISGGDFDNDSDTDYIVGNLGLNTKMKASESQPVSVYAKDFDDNAIVDPLFTAYNQDKEYLVHPRGTLIGQLISMRRRFKTFKEYGETTFDKVLPAADLKNIKKLQAYTFANSYLENKGNGHFELKPLPIEAQFSVMYGTLIKDFNDDGNLDILSVGNDYGTEVLTGRYDAGIGNYLQGDGKGNFKNVSVRKSNFFVKGDARAIAQLHLKNGNSLYLVSQINNKLLSFVQQDEKNSITKKIKRKQEKYIGSGYLSQSSTRY